MAVEDLRDTRVLIPRMRRALEGPAAIGSAASELTDDMVNAIVADSISNIILYTGGLFGHQLQVTDRDDAYLAPIAWLVDPALSEAEDSVVIAQGALDYAFNTIKALKVSETIRDEASEWSWQLSANAVSEWLRNLRALRDKAIEQIEAAGATALESYTSFIEVRDQYTSALIEPWVESSGGRGGQVLGDPRFY